MLILTIRTDKPDAKIGLFNNEEQLDYEVWQADRELSITILQKIKDVLKRNQKTFENLEGIIGFEGPGSFTGLRIGLTVANTLAYGLKIPIVGSGAEEWIKDGVARLKAGENKKIALPKYGRSAHITKPKH